MMGRRRGMAGALGGTAIRPNEGVAIANGAVTNGGEQYNSVDQIRIEVVNTQREAIAQEIGRKRSQWRV